MWLVAPHGIVQTSIIFIIPVIPWQVSVHLAFSSRIYIFRNSLGTSGVEPDLGTMEISGGEA